jgi:hypothetical protein
VFISFRSRHRGAGARVPCAFVSCALVLAAPGVADAEAVSTQLAAYESSASAVSAGRGYVAVAVGDTATRTLYVGHPGAIAPAKGVGELPDWAVPHVGIDAAQKTVVVYPRCREDPDVCDLYAYEVLTGTERPLGAVNSSASELEGTIDHGTIAFTRSTGLAPKHAQTQTPVARKLYVLPRGARTARQVSAVGGVQLALRGTRIAQVVDRDPAAGTCGKPSVELLSTQTPQKRVIDTTVCGLDMATVGSPALIGDAVLWTWRSAAKSGSFVYQLNLTTGVRSRAAVTQPVRSYAATSVRGGYLLASAGEGGGTVPLLKLTGLTFAAAPSGHGA